MLGVVNAAIPFTLIAWGEKHIDSGVAAIANAIVPIFVVLLAIRFRPSERARGLRLAGILLGLVGVGVLAGAHPQGGWWGVAGTLAVVVASVSYAVGGALRASALIARSPAGARRSRRLDARRPLVLLPFAIVAAAVGHARLEGDRLGRRARR